MSDIFLSYSREDGAAVEPLAEALVQAGYSVWWDRNLTGGERFLSQIQTELDAAKAVVVVWTKRSVESHWVIDEASAGRDSGRLVPVTLDGTLPPLGFRQFQVLDLSRWKPGEQGVRGVFDELRAAVSRLVGGGAASPTGPASSAAPGPIAASTPSATPPGRPTPQRRLLLAAALVAGVGILAAFGWFAMRPKAALDPERLAFFGFAADGADPRSVQIADIATTETFEALSVQQVSMAARSETVGTAAGQQFARAKALGARFTLSGDIKPEPGKVGEVRISVRLEDAGTRSTLWEDSFAADATEPLPVAVRAATQGGDTVLCFLQRYPRLAARVADADLLGPLATFCGGWRAFPSKAETIRALQRLTELAPEDADVHARYALFLFDRALEPVVGSGTDGSSLQEAERAFRRAEELDPEELIVSFLRYRFLQFRGAPLAESEAVLRAALDHASAENRDIAGYQVVRSFLGITLQNAGRMGDGLRLAKRAHETDPFSPTRHFAYVMALLYIGGEWQDPWRSFRERWPAALSRSRGYSDLMLLERNVFDDESALRRILERPPVPLSASTRACWQGLDDVLRIKDPRQQRPQAARIVEGCFATKATSPAGAISLLARVGELDAAFELARIPSFDPRNPDPPFTTGILFLPDPSMKAMRADPRFLPLMERLGLMDYWRTTKSQPDLCATEAAPFCARLAPP